MKKLAIAGILIASTAALVACDGADVEAAQEQRMTCVERTLYGDILCDNRTGVVCVMVDQNGKPLVVGEDEND